MLGRRRSRIETQRMKDDIYLTRSMSRPICYGSWVTLALHLLLGP